MTSNAAYEKNFSTARRAVSSLLVVGLLVLAGTASAGRGGGGGGRIKPDRAAPAITISFPTAGATTNAAITVAGNASDNVQVSSVAVSVDGGPYQGAQGTASWSYNLDTKAYANGSHTVTALAVDAAGNTSAVTVGFGVLNTTTQPSDSVLPSVSISSPGPGTTLSGTVTVSGTASDNVQVASVAVSADGSPYQPAQGTTNWSYALATASYANGSHTLSVEVTDTAGNVSTASVGVTIQNGLPAGIAQQLITPEGATIQIASGVSGWTAQQVYDLLKPNAYDLTRLGPLLTVKVQTQYSSQTTTGASESGGVYSNYRATIYLQATGSSVFTSRPDYIIAHEYGHAWTMYHLFISQAGSWTSYLQARGIIGDPRIDSTFTWSKNEMIADDYRMLFGTPAAISESFYINSDVPDSRNVVGLRDFFLNVWAAS